MPSEKLVKLMEDAKIIYDATDKYAGDLAVTKYALLLACSEFSDTPVKISKRRFPLSEDDLKKAKEESKDIIDGIRVAEKEYYDSLKKPVPVEPLPVLTPEELSFAKEVEDHLKDDPVMYFKSVFWDAHIGDEPAFLCMMLCTGSQSVLNSKGLHTMLTGKSGKGKTACVDHFLPQIPPQYTIVGSLSNKALMVHDMPNQGVFYLDDKNLTDDMLAVLKTVMNDNRESQKHRTVGANFSKVTLHTPERPVFFISKVEGTGDDQFFNRTLKPYVDADPETDKKVSERMFENAEKLPSNLIKSQHRIKVAREMWLRIRKDLLHVIIPGMSEYETPGVSDRRYPEILVEMIMAFARIRFMKRESSKDGDISVIRAAPEDIEDATSLMKMITGGRGSQQSHLLEEEYKIVVTILDNRLNTFTVPELLTKLKQNSIEMSYNTLYNHFHGRSNSDRNGSRYEGILNKCPYISVEKTSESERIDQIQYRERGGHDVLETKYKGKQTTTYTVEIDFLKTWITQISLVKKRKDLPDLPENTSFLQEKCKTKSSPNTQTDVGMLSD